MKMITYFVGLSWIVRLSNVAAEKRIHVFKCDEPVLKSPPPRIGEGTILIRTPIDTK